MRMKRTLAQIVNSLAIVDLLAPDGAFFFFSESHCYLLVPVGLHLMGGDVGLCVSCYLAVLILILCMRDLSINQGANWLLN